MNTTVTTNDKKNYVSLLIADFISSFGSSMTALAIMLEIFRDTESLFVSAVFSALTIIPKIIITFAMPKINIHMKYRSLFAMGEITCAGLLGTILINKSVAYICVIYSIFGIMFFILECYRSEFLKVISTEETIYKYQSVSRAVNVIVNVVAPLVAGILLSYASIDMVIVVDMITYILAALIILRIDGSLFTLKQEISKKRSISLKFLWGENSYIYKGSIIITFLGGATSILTLAYINDFLGESEMHYTILMSAMALGGFFGSLIGGIPSLQGKNKKISNYGLIAMGLLLLSVLLKPGFYFMIVILFVSGIISSLIMYYYATQLFMVFGQDEIRTKYAIFDNVIDVSTAMSKPFAAGIEKIMGVIGSIASMGVIFIVSKWIIRDTDEEE